MGWLAGKLQRKVVQIPWVLEGKAVFLSSLKLKEKSHGFCHTCWQVPLETSRWTVKTLSLLVRVPIAICHLKSCSSLPAFGMTKRSCGEKSSAKTPVLAATPLTKSFKWLSWPWRGGNRALASGRRPSGHKTLGRQSVWASGKVPGLHFKSLPNSCVCIFPLSGSTEFKKLDLGSMYGKFTPMGNFYINSILWVFMGKLSPKIPRLNTINIIGTLLGVHPIVP